MNHRQNKPAEANHRLGADSLDMENSKSENHARATAEGKFNDRRREPTIATNFTRIRQLMNEPIKLSIAATSKRVDIANVVSLSFFNNVPLPRQSQLDVAMGWRDSELGGTGPATLVDRKKYDFGFGNPVGLSRMAYLGVGFYKKKIPLRAIGVFPTWDRLIFAVRKDSGIQSLEDIKKQKYPLRISTRRKGKLQTTLYAIEEVLKAYGIRLSDIERWGGKVMEAPSPSSGERRDAIRSRKGRCRLRRRCEELGRRGAQCRHAILAA